MSFSEKTHARPREPSAVAHALEFPAKRKSEAWRARYIKAIALHGLAIIGFAHLVTLIWPEVGFPDAKQWFPITLSNVTELRGFNDIYPDTDYPLRPATEPWDISQSYPYPRRLSKNVTEGTWLRIAVHPVQDDIVFDMLGDLYCMSRGGGRSPPGSLSVSRAHAFLTGVPYDKEAEFSQDGSSIVFISDAGFGVDNIWTMPYTNCEDMARRSAEQQTRSMTTQQTNSTFRFFSSPSFHPTQPKLIATKWYLTGRPNGAGEIWEFPLIQPHDQSALDARPELPERGGTRIIARKLPASWPAARYPESQLGVDQARYVPTGDGIVFSRNVRDDDSGKFSYNKDVHAGINAVFLLNTTTGATRELVAAAASAPNRPASPGGANTPRLSRDGRTLAFVRRVRDESVLVLRDMRSGSLRHAWGGLTYDLSTIPAFMGPYPSYGWSADDGAIVIWAQGQIWSVPLEVNALGERVAAHGAAPQKLGFEAHVDVALGQTRYNENDIRGAELSPSVQVRSLRGLRSDEAGTRVVFEAAGDNIVFNLDSRSILAVPKSDEDESCYSPSFLSGSTQVIQACWHDQNLTHLVLSDPSSKTPPQVIEGLPRGRYTSPVSDGAYVSFVRTGKDYMFGDIEETYGEGVWIGRLHAGVEGASISDLQHVESLQSSSETKLEIAAIDGRATLLVQNPSSVVEYDIQSGRQRRIAAGKTAVEVVAAPHPGGSNSMSLAFRDFQHIWFCSGLSTISAGSNPGEEVWSKPGDPQTPEGLVRLSEHGGHDVAFSGDRQTVFWLHGPRLYYADVASVVSACQGASPTSRDSGACAQTAVSQHYLNVTFPTIFGQEKVFAGEANVFAIRNASLISMDPAQPTILENATIITQKGQIIEVGPGNETSIPDKAEVLDAQGGAVLPGYVDVHGHWGGFLSPFPLQSWEMETFLGYGVTTIHNPASKNVAGMVERNLIEKGRVYGPRVFHTGDVLYGSTQPPVYTEIRSMADARSALLRVKVEGGEAAFSVKNYQLAARSSRQRLLAAAGELGMLVVPEGGWSLDWDLSYFVDGYTSLEHPVPVPELYDDVLSLVAASGSSYTPLAVMNYGGIFGQHYIHQRFDVPNDEKLRRYLKHDILEGLMEVKQAPRSSYQFFNTSRSTAKLAARGVRTNVGAHGEQPIGFLYHSEMWMMSLGGQEPYDVLRHATLGGSTSLGLNGSIGSVEKGKLADLVIYPPGWDSIEKVWNGSMHMKYVMSRGILFSVEDGLVEAWPRNGRRHAKARFNADTP